MGKDSPDGMVSNSDVGRSVIQQQAFRHFQFSDYSSIDASHFYDAEYVHTDPYHIVRIQGFRVLTLDAIPFYIYAWYNNYELGNYYITNQLEVNFVGMDNYILDTDDVFGCRILNTDEAGHTFYYYAFGQEFLKPVGWVHRPSAAYTMDDSTPAVDQVVAFTDASLYSPVSWYWDFGDGSYSQLQNPTHAYSEVGRYTVVLNVSNAGGSDIFSDVCVVG